MPLIELNGSFNSWSGKLGKIGFRKTKWGTDAATLPTNNNPDTPAQNAVRSNFTKVTRQWKTLTAAQAATWHAWAAEHPKVNHRTGKTYIASAFNWFVGFGSRYLAVNTTETTAPTDAPTSTYGGDNITLTAAAVTGGVKFTASAANGSKQVTALLVQKIPNPNCAPTKGGYRTKSYHAFPAGTLSFTVNLTPGYYSVGYQFVDTQTGQESEFVLLGTVGPIALSLSQGGAQNKKAA